MISTTSRRATAVTITARLKTLFTVVAMSASIYSTVLTRFPASLVPPSANEWHYGDNSSMSYGDGTPITYA